VRLTTLRLLRAIIGLSLVWATGMAAVLLLLAAGKALVAAIAAGWYFYWMPTRESLVRTG
jgi:hypothetical protein